MLHEDFINQVKQLFANNDSEGAIQLVHNRKAMCQSENDSVGLIECLGIELTIRGTLEQFEQCLSLCREIEQIARDTNNRVELARSVLDQTRIFRALGDDEA